MTRSFMFNIHQVKNGETKMSEYQISGKGQGLIEAKIDNGILCLGASNLGTQIN